jgi:hypothetical protein
LIPVEVVPSTTEAGKMSQDREEMEIENNSWWEFCECINICLWILSDPFPVLIISPVASGAAD